MKNLLLQAGGITDKGNRNEIEIIRKRKTIDKRNLIQDYNDLIKISIDSNFLIKGTENYFLEANDIINIKMDESVFDNKTVYINGEVINPGYYTLLNNEERLADIIKRANGLTAFANIAGGRVFRKEAVEVDEKSINDEVKYLQKLYKIDSSFLKRDSLNRSSILSMKNIIIDFNKAIENPQNENNIILENNDSIYIPGHISTVKIEGEVYTKGLLVYMPGKKLKYYLNLASGATKNADKSRIFVVNQNGAGNRTKSFLGLGLFKKYPEISEGCIIFIPPKYDKNILSAAQGAITKPINGFTNFLNGLSGSLLSLYLIKGL